MNNLTATSDYGLCLSSFIQYLLLKKAEVLQEAEYSEEDFDLHLAACSFVSELGLYKGKEAFKLLSKGGGQVGQDA